MKNLLLIAGLVTSSTLTMSADIVFIDTRTEEHPDSITIMFTNDIVFEFTTSGAIPAIGVVLKDVYSQDLDVSIASNGGSSYTDMGVVQASIQPKGDGVVIGASNYGPWLKVNSAIESVTGADFIAFFTFDAPVASFTVGDEFVVKAGSITLNVGRIPENSIRNAQLIDGSGIAISAITNIASVPEPSTYALWGATGLFGLVMIRRRCKK